MPRFIYKHKSNITWRLKGFNINNYETMTQSYQIQGMFKVFLCGHCLIFQDASCSRMFGPQPSPISFRFSNCFNEGVLASSQLVEFVSKGGRPLQGIRCFFSLSSFSTRKMHQDAPDWDNLGYAPGIIFDEHDRTKIPGNHLGYPLDAESPSKPHLLSEPWSNCRGPSIAQCQGMGSMGSCGMVVSCTNEGLGGQSTSTET